MSNKKKQGKHDSEQDEAKAKPGKAPLLCEFFGPECQDEIAEDGTLTRGAEKFCATAKGDNAPDGWQAMATHDSGTVLWRQDA